MLGALRFELTAPTPRVFLRRLVKAAHALGPADPRCALLQAAGRARLRAAALRACEHGRGLGALRARPRRSGPWSARALVAHAHPTVLAPSGRALAVAPAGPRRPTLV